MGPRAIYEEYGFVFAGGSTRCGIDEMWWEVLEAELVCGIFTVTLYGTFQEMGGWYNLLFGAPLTRLLHC